MEKRNSTSEMSRRDKETEEARDEKSKQRFFGRQSLNGS